MESIVALLKQVGDIPRPVWAVAAGILAGFGMTQRLRALLPEKWDPKTSEVATQALVFVIAFNVTHLVYGPPPGDAISAALVTGLATPALWNVLLVVIGWWKPELRDALINPRKSA